MILFVTQDIKFKFVHFVKEAPFAKFIDAQWRCTVYKIKNFYPLLLWCAERLTLLQTQNVFSPYFSVDIDKKYGCSQSIKPRIYNHTYAQIAQTIIYQYKIYWYIIIIDSRTGCCFSIRRSRRCYWVASWEHSACKFIIDMTRCAYDDDDDEANLNFWPLYVALYIQANKTHYLNAS